MNRRKYKTVGLYCARKNYETGNGYKGKTIKIEGLSPEEIKKRCDEIKIEQKQLNKEFKEEKKRMQRENRLTPQDIDDKFQKSIEIPEGRNPLKHHNNFSLKLDKDTGNTTFLIGSSKSGKTTTLMWLYNKYYSSSKNIAILFSINKHIELYKGHKHLLRCPSFNKDAEKLVMMEKYINTKCKNKYNFVNILDDIIDVRHNKTLNEQILTWRNSNLSNIVSLQYSNLLAKEARASVNNVLLFKFGTDEAIEVAIKTFLRSIFRKLGYRSLDDQIALYKQLTDNHGFIYIHPASGHFSVHRLRL